MTDTKLRTFLWFDDRLEEALDFYKETFGNVIVHSEFRQELDQLGPILLDGAALTPEDRGRALSAAALLTDDTVESTARRALRRQLVAARPSPAGAALPGEGPVDSLARRYRTIVMRPSTRGAMVPAFWIASNCCLTRTRRVVPVAVAPVGRRRGVWLIQAAKARNIGGQFENARIVNLIDHWFGLTIPCCSPI